MDAPVWLSDTPEIHALLSAVLDRFDRQSGEARARHILLDLERFAPTLARNDGAADQLWELIRDLERMGVLGIRTARRTPYDSPWVGAKAAFSPTSEPTLREWLQRPATAGVMQQWREAVTRHAEAFADAGSALADRRIAIAGRTNAEVVAALATLARIDRPTTLRQLSAVAFWGDSKVLDERGDLVAKLFPQVVIRERAVIVAAYLPAHIQAVLFIENQDTYATAIRAQNASTVGHALVYMSGFRGTSARVRSDAGAVLHCCGPGVGRSDTDFHAWWFLRRSEPWPLHFWGDLDFAGMQILKTLRSRFDGVTAWRPGYERMLEALQTERAHSRTESGQVDPGLTGCDFADQLMLPAIRAHGFCDQESIVLDADPTSRQ